MNLTEQWELKRPEWERKQQEFLTERARIAKEIAEARWSEGLHMYLRGWFVDSGVTNLDDAIRLVSDTRLEDIPSGIGPVMLRKFKVWADLPCPVSERAIARAIALLKKNGYAVHPKNRTLKAEGAKP